MPHDYPVGTFIKCVMVTGEGHGMNYLKTPVDADGFKMMKRQALPVRFMESTAYPMDIQTETIYYEPFLELYNRDGFVRLFSPRDYTTRNSAISILQIADALRIAGIDSL